MASIINTYKESLSGLSKEVWIISLLMLINRSGLMVVPFLSIYLTEYLEFTLLQAGQIGMWFGIGSLVSSILGGSLTDRFGYSNIMKFSLVAGGLSFWVLLLAKSFTSLCIFIFCTALLADLLRPAVMTSISYYSTESNRTRAISLLRMAINVGIAIGPAVGGLLVSAFGYNWLFIVNGSTSIITFILFSLIYPKMKVHNEIDEEIGIVSAKKKTAYNDYNYFYLLFIIFLISVSFLQIIFSVPLFFKTVYEFSEMMVGLFFTLNGLMIVIFEMPIVNYFEKQRSFYKPIMWGGVLMLLAFISLMIPAGGGITTWILPFLLYSTFIGIGEILNLPFFNSLALARSTKKNSGSYMGLFAFNFSLSFTAAPVIGSYIVDKYGFPSLWLICGLFCFISILMFHIYRKKFLISENYK